jgi:hypothetical protein
VVRDDDGPFLQDGGILFLAAGLLLSGTVLTQPGMASEATGGTVTPPTQAVPAVSGECPDVPMPRSVKEPWMSLAISADVMQDLPQPIASGYATLTNAVAPVVEKLLTRR